MCGINSHPIGVDVEKLGKDREKTAKRVMTEEEYSEYIAAENRAKYFYKIWVKKESYLIIVI